MTENHKKYIEFAFISLTVCLFFICKTLFHWSSATILTALNILLGTWVLFRFFCFKSFQKTNILEVGILIFILFLSAHYFLFAKSSIYYLKLWTYIDYVLIYFLFKELLSQKKQVYIEYILANIVFVAFLEACFAILQYTGALEVEKSYFLLLGSFSSPNFLAAYLSFGFSIVIWSLLIKKNISKTAKTLSIFLLILFGSVILISKSRATWLALVGGLSTLLITSKKYYSLIKQSSLLKKTLSTSFLIVAIVPCSYFLYNLKPASVNGRILVAKITSQEILKKPITGHGILSFAGGYNEAKASYFSKTERPWEEVQNATYVFTAFNDYLLLLYEVGIPITLFGCTLLLLTLLKTSINVFSRIGLALFINILILSLFTSPLGVVPLTTISFFSFTILLTSIKTKKTAIPPKTKLIMRSLIICIAIIGISINTTRLYSSNKLRTYYKTSQDSIDLDKALLFSKLNNNNLFSNYHFGLKLYQYGYKKESFTYMENAFAYSVAPKIGKRLGFFYTKEGNYKRAEELFKMNIATEPYRYEPRIDLLNLYVKTNDYKKALAIAEEILNLNVKIPSDKITAFKNRAKTYTNHYTKKLKQLEGLEGTLSSAKVITSDVLHKKLSYKVYLPPIEKITKKLPVIYINDGHKYIDLGNLPKLLDSLIVNNTIKPVAAIFLTPKDGYQKGKNVRQELFLCNPNFISFFTKEFIPTIEARYPISSDRKDRTILGLSFGGLAAAYIGNEATSYFKNVAMQSPAFHPCKDIYRNFAKNKKKDLKIYLSYGTGKDTEGQDIPMIKILQRKNYELKVERVENGNHNWKLWKPQLKNMLLYFFTSNNP